MQIYKDLDELYTAVKDHVFDNVDFYNRDQLIDSVVSEYFKYEMTSKESKYRFRYLMKLPMIGNYLFTRRVKEYIVWINNVFPVDRCVSLSKETKEDLLKNFELYKQAFELLDPDSKKTMLDLLALKLSGDFRYAKLHYNSNPQYLSDKISWKKNPNIVDAGGFIGDTLLSFIQNNIIPGRYYIYELEDENYHKLLSNIKIAERQGCIVNPRKKGVYSQNGELYFVANGDSSLIVDYPTESSIDVLTIDSDVDIPIDFIKMDIEGAETEAIKGATETITKYSPTLAICIYHLKDDYWKIPLLIKEINPNYSKFWIEQYQLGYNETVLYVSV